VDHCRRIHHVSKPFYGTTNDKKVMQNDTYPCDLINNRVHRERVFQTYNSLGQLSKWQGAWLLTDNGYGRYMSLQCPDHHATDHDEVMFAEWLESMRKDIECTFGILKSRFRILKNAIRLYFEDDIEDLFRTCAVLHNILLQFDGLLSVDWVAVDPNVEEPEVDPEATQPLDMDPDQTQDIRDKPLLDANYQPTQHDPDDQIIEWNQNMFFELRGALIKNLAYQFRMGRVEWPKTFSADDKGTWTPDRIIERTAKRYQESISRVVYIRDSVLRRRDVTGAFTMLIGLGLFARTAFREGEKIIFFVGELFTNLDEFDEERAGHKPYILHSKKADEYGTGEWLDCFNTRAQN
jgi:hypothetical protein